MGLKFAALVSCDLLGTAEMSNSDGDEGFSNCFGGDVRQRECLRPMGVSVEGSETVPEARRGRQRPHQVNKHMRETCRQEVETPERGLYVLCYLGSLAGCTHACPCTAVFPHSRPHKPLGLQLDGGVGPRVANAVDDVKDLASKRCGYEWPLLWSGCVTLKVDVCPGNLHLF